MPAISSINFSSPQQRLAGIALVVISGAGCASPEVPPIPEFETVAIQAKQLPSEGLSFKSGADSSEDASKTGAKVGAAAGGAIGIACLPLFGPLCLPAAIGGGGFYGAFGGHYAGKAWDVLNKFPPEVAQQFEQELREAENTRNFSGEMHDAVANLIPISKQVAADKAQAVFHIGPDALILVRGQESNLAIRMTASLFAEWDRDKGWPTVAHRWYVYTTPERPIDEWVNNEGEAIDAALTECITEIAALIGKDAAVPRELTNAKPDAS